jgi:hypothetical protein
LAHGQSSNTDDRDEDEEDEEEDATGGVVLVVVIMFLSNDNDVEDVVLIEDEVMMMGLGLEHKSDNSNGDHGVSCRWKYSIIDEWRRERRSFFTCVLPLYS